MKIERMNKGEWGKIRAFFDIRTDEGFVVKGFKLVNGVKGLFVGFPSQKGQDDEYYDTVWAETELRDKLTQIAINEYGGDISMQQNSGINMMEPQPVSQQSPAETIPSSEPFSEDDIPF